MDPSTLPSSIKRRSAIPALVPIVAVGISSVCTIVLVVALSVTMPTSTSQRQNNTVAKIQMLSWKADFNNGRSARRSGNAPRELTKADVDPPTTTSTATTSSSSDTTSSSSDTTSSSTDTTSSSTDTTSSSSDTTSSSTDTTSSSTDTTSSSSSITPTTASTSPYSTTPASATSPEPIYKKPAALIEAVLNTQNSKVPFLNQAIQPRLIDVYNMTADKDMVTLYFQTAYNSICNKKDCMDERKKFLRDNVLRDNLVMIGSDGTLMENLKLLSFDIVNDGGILLTQQQFADQFYKEGELMQDSFPAATITGLTLEGCDDIIVSDIQQWMNQALMLSWMKSNYGVTGYPSGNIPLFLEITSFPYPNISLMATYLEPPNPDSDIAKLVKLVNTCKIDSTCLLKDTGAKLEVKSDIVIERIISHMQQGVSYTINPACEGKEKCCPKTVTTL